MTDAAVSALSNTFDAQKFGRALMALWPIVTASCQATGSGSTTVGIVGGSAHCRNSLADPRLWGAGVVAKRRCKRGGPRGSTNVPWHQPMSGRG